MREFVLPLDSSTKIEIVKMNSIPRQCLKASRSWYHKLNSQLGRKWYQGLFGEEGSLESDMWHSRLTKTSEALRLLCRAAHISHMVVSPKLYLIMGRFRNTHSRVSSTEFNRRERTIWENEAENHSNNTHTLELCFAIVIRWAGARIKRIWGKNLTLKVDLKSRF